MEYKRVIFDLNGTLFPSVNYEGRIKTIMDAYGMKYDEKSIKGMLKAMGTYEDVFSSYTIKDYSEYLSYLSGLNLDEDFILYFLSRKDILAPNTLITGVRETLEYLKERYDLIVLTNFFAKAQYEQMAYLDIAKYFSSVLGGDTLKPHPDAFIKASKPYKVEECVMIGDDYEKDIMGAKSASMPYIHYNPNGKENNDQEINDIRRLKYIL